MDELRYLFVVDRSGTGLDLSVLKNVWMIFIEISIWKIGRVYDELLYSIIVREIEDVNKIAYSSILQELKSNRKGKMLTIKWKRW